MPLLITEANVTRKLSFKSNEYPANFTVKWKCQSASRKKLPNAELRAKLLWCFHLQSSQGAASFPITYARYTDLHKHRQLIDPFCAPKPKTGYRNQDDEYWFARKLNSLTRHCNLPINININRCQRFPCREQTSRGRGWMLKPIARSPDQRSHKQKKKKNSLKSPAKHTKQKPLKTNARLRRRRRQRSGHALYKINWAYLLEFIKRFTAQADVQRFEIRDPKSKIRNPKARAPHRVRPPVIYWSTTTTTRQFTAFGCSFFLASRARRLSSINNIRKKNKEKKNQTKLTAHQNNALLPFVYETRIYQTNVKNWWNTKPSIDYVKSASVWVRYNSNIC